MPRYTELPLVNDEDFNTKAMLPYGLTHEQIKNAIEKTHLFLQKTNTYLISEGYSRLEEMLLGNSFAGILSEIVVKNVADVSTTLNRNLRVGGYPDLIPKGRYEKDQILRGEGIEVKLSKQSGGWQGHNPEEGWILIFKYAVDTHTLPIELRYPTRIVEVYSAELVESDWNFSGRNEKSRRTITASINLAGMTKLRNNLIYRSSV